ncbi:MAG: glycosyl hydrolase family 57, partial [Actinomycetota bacterium]
MQELPEYLDDLPNLCGSEPLIEATIAAGRERPVFLGQTSVNIADIDAAFAVALHMHQPLIPAGGLDLRTAATVSNLEWMAAHP